MGSGKRFFEVGHFYHVMTKSIAGYVVFNSTSDYDRMKEMMEFYKFYNVPFRFSSYKKLKESKKTKKNIDLSAYNKLVDILAYCIMPTHIHILLTPLHNNGVSVYLQNLLNSYTRYFNEKNRRKGPLWQGRFKSVAVNSDEQLLHLTRYIHLNPTSSGLVDKPEDWKYSSYREYVELEQKGICNFKDYINTNPDSYKEFVVSRKNYQRELEIIKHLLLE